MGSILFKYRFKIVFFIFSFLFLFENSLYSVQESSYKEAFESKPLKKQKTKKVKEPYKNKDQSKDKGPGVGKTQEKDIFAERDYEKLYTAKAAKSFLADLEYSRAFIILKKLLDKNPQDREVNFLLGRIYSYSKEYQKAAFYFIKGGSDAFVDSSSGYDYGVTFYMLRDYSRAIQGFRRVEDNHPLKNIVNFYLGVCYLEMNRLPLALVFFKKAKNLPDNYRSLQERYIEYLEVNMNITDQKIFKKRVRKITRKELPELPQIVQKSGDNKSYTVNYDSKTSSSSKNQESKFYEITPYVDQSINYTNYEYGTEILSSSFYKYKGGLNIKLEPVFSSGKKSGVTFSVPVDLAVDSFGVVMISSDTPINSEFSSSVDFPSSSYMYKSTSDFKNNSSLSLQVSPRLEIGMGTLSSFWGEYDYTYNIKGFKPDSSAYTHETWVGFSNLGSKSIFVDISAGFESFLAWDYDYPSNVVTSNLSLFFKSSSASKIKLATDFYYGLEKEGKKEDIDNYLVCVHDSSSNYVCDGINSSIIAGYELSNSAVSLELDVNYFLPVGEQERVDSSSVSVNGNFKYIGSKYFGLYLNMAISNITLDNTSYGVTNKLSFSPISTLFLNLETSVKYFSQYKYHLYSEYFDSYQTEIAEKGGYSVSLNPNILYEPFKWLGFGIKFEYVYNEFNIPEEEVEYVYFWHPDKNIGADFSHYNLVCNIKLSYSF